MISLRSAAAVGALVALAAACTLSTSGTAPEGSFVGGGGSSSSGMMCQPGTTKPCYSGPSGTEGVGRCKGGTSVCGPDGTQGACSGDVVPAFEDCTTAVDDNCDGHVNEAASGCICQPNQLAACYTGPAATMGVGSCKSGNQACSADGKSLGACTGSVLPSFDDCVTVADEDCDGKVVACTGDALWAQTWGGNQDDHVYVLAVDGAGDSFVSGGYQGVATFGATMLTSKGDYDVFLAKYDPAGTLLFEKSFGDDQYQLATAGAATADSGVVIAGDFKGILNLGGADLMSAGGTDVFVVKFDKDGQHVWSKRFGDSQDQIASSVAIDANGNVGLTGYFFGSMSFDASAPTLNSAGARDIFVAELDKDGAYKWSASYGDWQDQYSYSAAFDAMGDLVVVGGENGTLDFGGGVKAVSAGDSDAFIASFDPKGTPVWCRSFGDGLYQAFYGVAIDAKNDVVVTGGVDGTVDFGGGMLASGGNLDVIVAKYDQNGFYVIAKRAGDAQSQFGLLTRIDPAGNIVVTGAFAGTMDLGGGPANSAGGYDAFVAKLDPGSNYVWMKHWGDNQDQGGVRVGVDAQANVLVAGDFKGDIDFGKGPVTSKGQDDSFLVKLAP